MKKFIFGITLILFISAVCPAQNRKTSPDQVDQNERVRGQKMENSGEQSEDVLLRAGTSLEAQLQSTLDVKKSRVGDEVIFRTTKTIKEDGQVVISKGTRLIGRVTEVSQKTKAKGESKIGLVFESIEGKNLSAPISATIISVTNIRQETAVGDLAGTSTTAGSSTQSTAGSGGGGLLGTGGLVGGVLDTTGQTVGGAVNTVGTVGGAVTQTAGGTIGRIQTSQSAGASAEGSTIFSVAGKNLRIEKGANFQLRLNESVGN